MSQLSSESGRQIAVKALLLGDRIETAGLKRRDVFSTSPFAFRIEGGAFLVLFRYGIAVLFGMSPVQEDEIIRSLNERIAHGGEGVSADRDCARGKTSKSRPMGLLLLKHYCLSTFSSSLMRWRQI